MSTIKKTLVIGASANPERYANRAVKMLLQHGHPVVAIGKQKGNIDGVEIETERLPFKDIDTVTLYVNPVHQRDYYDYILSLNPKRVVFNPGAENPEFYSILEKHNVFVDVGCSLVMLTTNQY